MTTKQCHQSSPFDATIECTPHSKNPGYAYEPSFQSCEKTHIKFWDKIDQSLSLSDLLRLIETKAP